ncbi:hypothetical protein PF005_g8145 [Phytophthora fragariae]|uniref:Secreted protein n=1 Tax=Phytophthora fragariae TaxID=53985 RepID=A0A6A3UE94_9STRA|nr:hypothetical protein PF003_g12792 [Phytophthora fragariae]KAE8940857.1 hypothetical protein PF009_g9340 [Phytophthora fragariae]KAE9118770.1 hypothetical protein PF007_g8802 [Phytophthora fragariae]KAE9149814.1 hypothetical protein PF006_g5748 [Phytophthora fragariae]KAE9218743.1 hypothetical protein PF005_g8145 [Phytophthora fragariae]
MCRCIFILKLVVPCVSTLFFEQEIDTNSCKARPQKQSVGRQATAIFVGGYSFGQVSLEFCLSKTTYTSFN